jgi:molecular chaperone GrpE
MSDEREPSELEAERAARLRLAADFANFRRRTAEEGAAAGAAALEAFIARLLPLSDFIDLALAALPPDLAASGHAEGLRGLRRELDAALASVAVERLDPLGLPFDPSLHEASATEAVDGIAPGSVSRVLRPGFRRAGRLLRPALVAVAPEPPAPGPRTPTGPEAVTEDARPGERG